MRRLRHPVPTFAEKLRAMRDEQGISEARLAELADLPFGTVHNYGLGARAPTFVAVVRLARALGVTCEAFADCEDILQGEVRGKPKDGTPGSADRSPTEPRPRGRPRKAGGAP